MTVKTCAFCFILPGKAGLFFFSLYNSGQVSVRSINYNQLCLNWYYQQLGYRRTYWWYRNRRRLYCPKTYRWAVFDYNFRWFRSRGSLDCYVQRFLPWSHSYATNVSLSSDNVQNFQVYKKTTSTERKKHTHKIKRLCFSSCCSCILFVFMKPLFVVLLLIDRFA